jgi:hypothetical protein
MQSQVFKLAKFIKQDQSILSGGVRVLQGMLMLSTSAYEPWLSALEEIDNTLSS